MRFPKLLTAIFILGLIYSLAPGSSTVLDFSGLPGSLKSDEPGDTVQLPNIVAYFSDFNRAGITEFYRNEFRNKYFFGFLLPPLTINHPPREAYTYVRDQFSATFLEEYVYPLKGSLFVAGYEPYIENEMLKREHFFIRDHVHINGVYYNSKTTMRFYPAVWHIALITYIGIWIALMALFKLFKKVAN